VYKRQPSTTPARPRGKITPPAKGRAKSPSEARTAPRIVDRHHRSPVTLTLQFMPGAEPWVRITRDGVSWRRPATQQVWELLLELNGWYRDIGRVAD
jgi:hypothetical protein